MKPSTKNFTFGAISGVLATAAIIAWGPSGFVEDLSLMAADRFGNNMAILHGLEQCKTMHPARADLNGPALREQRNAVIACFSAWSPTLDKKQTAVMVAELPTALDDLSTFGINGVGDREKAAAQLAFESARPTEDTFGSLMLMSLLSGSQEGASPKEAEAAAAKARELLPLLKTAALRERGNGVKFATDHPLASAAFRLAGKGSLEEALAPPMAVKALSFFWLTQHFAEVEKSREKGSQKTEWKNVELAALHAESKVWAEHEWAALIMKNDDGSRGESSKI